MRFRWPRTTAARSLAETGEVTMTTRSMLLLGVKTVGLIAFLAQDFRNKTLEDFL